MYMRKIVKNIFSILDVREQLRLKQLIIMEAFISILDIGFLAMLLVVIHFYTTGDAQFLFGGISRDSLLPISVFFFLFTLKNIMAVYVFKSVSTFTFRVASRISKDNLELYLEGSYTDYINIDSSAHTRKISQQPIEFSY